MIQNKALIQDVSLNIKNGDMISIIGPNGSGKSTIIKLISGELLPSSGNIFFKTKDINDWDISHLASCRSVLSQSNHLSFPFSVLDIVRMGRYPLSDTGKENDDSICLEILNLFDLNDQINQNYTTLSGGEKQRVQLSRVFAQIWEKDSYNNKLLILDEPTSFLDIKHQYLLFDILNGMNSKGLTILMVLHDINHAISNSNKLIMLKDSKLISYGKIKEILTSEILKEVFDINLNLSNNKNFSNPLVLYKN